MARKLQKQSRSHPGAFDPSCNLIEEFAMRTLLSTVVLSVLSAPAFAFVNPQPVPEPETIALIAVGLVGVLASRLRNKK
jgi:hypothetical protein